MKHQYFRILVGLILTFGLCSCKSDSSPEQQADPFEVKSVDYIHTDKSIHNINDTKVLSINSSIQLNLTKANESDFTLTAYNHCYGGSLSGSSYHSQVWKNQTKILVKDLLPIEVFKPLKTKANEFICNFNMEIKNSLGSKTTIYLNEIKIKDLYQYYDMNVFDNPSSEMDHFILEDELEKEIPFFPQSGKAHLLCDNEVHSFQQEAPEFKFQKIKQYSVLQNEINFCRFVYEGNLKKQRQLGRYFYLQKKASHISFELSLDPPETYVDASKTHINLSAKPLSYLNITNQSLTPVYINLQSLQNSLVEVLGYYARGPESSTVVHNRSVVIGVKWEVEQDKVVTKGHHQYLMIPAKQSSLLIGNADKSIACGMGVSGYLTDVSQCNNSPFFHGYYFNLHNMPQLQVNRLSSLDNFNWMSYDLSSLLKPQQPLGGWSYQYWMGSPQSDSLCADLVTHTQPQIKSIIKSDSPLHSCQAN